MKIAAYSLRLGGPRSYEHGIIDIGGVCLSDDGSVIDEFHCLCRPDPDKSYRPSYLRSAGMTLESMAEGETPSAAALRFMDWADSFDGVWCCDPDLPAFLRCAMTDKRMTFQRSASVMALYEVLKAFGAPGPRITDFSTLAGWCKTYEVDYDLMDARQQAIVVAKTVLLLRERLAGFASDRDIVRQDTVAAPRIAGAKRLALGGFGG